MCAGRWSYRWRGGAVVTGGQWWSVVVSGGAVVRWCGGHGWSRVVTGGHGWSRVVTGGHSGGHGVSGGQWWSVVVSGGQWWSVVVSGGQWWSVVVSGGQWWSVVVSGGQWWSVVVSGVIVVVDHTVRTLVVDACQKCSTRVSGDITCVLSLTRKTHTCQRRHTSTFVVVDLLLSRETMPCAPTLCQCGLLQRLL